MTAAPPIASGPICAASRRSDLPRLGGLETTCGVARSPDPRVPGVVGSSLRGRPVPALGTVLRVAVLGTGVAGTIAVDVPEIPCLAELDRQTAASARDESGRHLRCPRLPKLLVDVPIAASRRRPSAPSPHVAPPSRFARRASRRRTTFCRSRSAYASGFVRLKRRSRQDAFPQMTRWRPVSSSPHSVQCVCSGGRGLPRFAAAFSRTTSRFRQ